MSKEIKPIERNITGSTGSKEYVDTPKSFEDYWRPAQISFKALLNEFDGDVLKTWKFVGEIKADNLAEYYNQAVDISVKEPTRKHLLLLDMVLNSIDTATSQRKIRHLLPHVCRRSSLNTGVDIFPHRMAMFFCEAELKVLDMGIDTGEESPFLELEKVLTEN